MKMLFRLVLLGLMLGGWVLSAAALHVVRTPTVLFKVFTKNELSFNETYIDARQWTLPDVGAHPKVVRRLVELGKADTLAFLVDTKNGDLNTQLLEAAAKGPPAPPAPAPAKTTKADAAKPGNAAASGKEKASIFDFGK